jgi:hypothetical protein
MIYHTSIYFFWNFFFQNGSSLIIQEKAIALKICHQNFPSTILSLGYLRSFRPFHEDIHLELQLYIQNLELRWFISRSTFKSMEKNTWSSQKTWMSPAPPIPGSKSRQKDQIIEIWMGETWNQIEKYQTA